ncbi:MAG TPA: phenylalanine--tRNA ligase subunit beta [Acidimicrobiales bacterium]|nr:phenylalanine--tRNA ligase subunit beta [Acidimicrobiales bacterium]
MRAPLSWLRDFAPFPSDIGALRDALDDLGLVVESIEYVGEGLGDVVVSRVLEIRPIKGADKIRLVLVDAGAGPDDPLEIVCGAHNFAVGDRVPLAPVGAILPGGFEIGRRKLRGVESNGMLCSGRELGLSDDGAGLLILGDEAPGEPGTPLMEALGLEPDVVFDITVEGNRPDAWSISGIARDLAGRLDLAFTLPEPPSPPAGDWPVESAASATVESLDLCPRLTVSVLGGVAVGPSPQWIARRLLLAGMRPINNVVDASNYVMLELGQPTHPYDLARLPGRGLSVRRARPGETVETLDGVTRTVGVRGRSLGDTGEDCLICDAEGTPVGIGGIMGGASSEIAATTTEVLLEAAYFTPMAIARTSKRLGLRTEASARFERGCDPWAIEPSVNRFCELLTESIPGLRVADGMLDVRGQVPEPFVVSVPIARVQSQLGVALDAEQIARLLEPIGFAVLEEVGAGSGPGGAGSGPSGTGVAGGHVTVEVPTNRPDVRREPYGVDDVIEEIARTYGYSKVPRRIPTWPQPGGLTSLQRSRREAKDVLVGLGASEGWTDTFVSADAHSDVSLRGDAVRVANPLDAEKPFLRRSLMPGLLSALSYNASRRQPDIRLFEVGTVFSHPGEGAPRVVERAGPGGLERAELPGERELLSSVLALEDDDARTAVAAWHVLADTFRVDGVRLVPPGAGTGAGAGGDAAGDEAGPLPGLHPTRSAHLVARSPSGEAVVLGAVGEIDPDVATTFGLTHTVGGVPAPRRVGWLEVDLGLLFDEERVARRPTVVGAVSRFPSSDIDLAFVVRDAHPADVIAEALGRAAGDVLESVRLFDVYRGTGIDEGSRSLAYRLRFCSPDRTLTDEDVGEVRARCIEAVATEFGAVLR